MKKRTCIIYVALFAANLSCRTATVSTPVLTEVEKKVTTKLSLKELLENKTKYHGVTVETEGELFYGFENFSIHYYDELKSGDSVFRQKNFSGLEINLERDQEFSSAYLTSINNKVVVVRGVVDTNYEKVSGLPARALLRNVFYLKPIE